MPHDVSKVTVMSRKCYQKMELKIGWHRIPIFIYRGIEVVECAAHFC